ncbi:hypothetical protein BD289DRAFT_188668 [Coniella lustricola]|uniref:Uncharacterized protein n=1 Tax=Coniella lustricola TaxID=2025994 RepID=A0A2T2ZSY0_9PEZI|nr:hypothetical protein BD289DRAFT_188668 [Coniella lustricola]
MARFVGLAGLAVQVPGLVDAPMLDTIDEPCADLARKRREEQDTRGPASSVSVWHKTVCSHRPGLAWPGLAPLLRAGLASHRLAVLFMVVWSPETENDGDRIGQRAHSRNIVCKWSMEDAHLSAAVPLCCASLQGRFARPLCWTSFFAPQSRPLSR